MIFKQIEITLISLPSTLRWCITVLLLSSILFFWYFFACVPLKKQINSLSHVTHEALENQQIQHVYEEHTAHKEKKLSQRLYYAKGYKDFIKDILASELRIKNSTTEKMEKFSGYAATHAHITLEGAFEKIYNFIKKIGSSYLCQWKKISLKPAEEAQLALEAEIVLYAQ